MHSCAFCRNPIRPLAEWRGDDGRLYCGEFCAEAGDSPPLPGERRRAGLASSSEASVS